MSRNKKFTFQILSMIMVAAVLLVACAPAGGDESEVEVF
jgi:hypothetical protein